VPGMNCLDFENVVVAIAREELTDAAARSEGLAHADTCARCARRLAGEMLLSDAVAAAIADDAPKQAPPHVVKMLLEARRERANAARRNRRIWIRRSVTGALAAALLIGSSVMLRRIAEPPSRHGTVLSTAPSLEDDTAGANGEVTTDFIPLDDDPAPAGATSLVRVQLPRTALPAFGLPLNEDRTGDLVQAEFLLDEDGQVRAVRFIE
jgi:hypothetical protein